MEKISRLINLKSNYTPMEGLNCQKRPQLKMIKNSSSLKNLRRQHTCLRHQIKLEHKKLVNLGCFKTRLNVLVNINRTLLIDQLSILWLIVTDINIQRAAFSC